MAGKAYAISDLHGHYHIFKQMLQKIQFDDTDILYILGDCNDRGIRSIEIYEYLKQHQENIFLIKGNHELMMRNYLQSNNWNCPDGRMWKDNGGMKTMDRVEQFLKRRWGLDADISGPLEDFRQWMIQYVDSLPSYIETTVNGQNYVLIHAGINPELPLEEQDEEICAWIREYFFMSPGLKGKTIVFGHTPTCHLSGIGDNYDIWRDPIYEDKIGIDGGLGPFPDGQLNCLCLNDLSVTVIKSKDAPDEE